MCLIVVLSLRSICLALFVYNNLKASGIPGLDRATQTKFGSWDCILHYLRDGPVRDPGNGSGWEWGSFLIFDCSEMIHINIHQQINDNKLTANTNVKQS